MNVFFEIIIVSYNAGDKLIQTLKSILEQEAVSGNAGVDYRVIIKDGNSTDTSIEQAVRFLSTYPAYKANRVQILRGEDAGIYDAMNRALNACLGKPGHRAGVPASGTRTFLYFINCGDTLAGNTVLKQVADAIHTCHETLTEAQSARPLIFYGDVIEDRTHERVSSNPVMDDFACYRHVPCHQACFYDAALFEKERFDTSLKVRADYDHFLKSFYRYHAVCRYLSVAVAHYEGGGFSEMPENRKLSEKEHRLVLRRYMDEDMIRRYDLRMKLTLQPVRTFLAENPKTARGYNTVRRALYRMKRG